MPLGGGAHEKHGPIASVEVDVIEERDGQEEHHKNPPIMHYNVLEKLVQSHDLNGEQIYRYN